MNKAALIIGLLLWSFLCIESAYSSDIDLSVSKEPFVHVTTVEEFNAVCDVADIDPGAIWEFDTDDAITAVYYRSTIGHDCTLITANICSSAEDKQLLVQGLTACIEKGNNMSDEEMEDVIAQCERTYKRAVCPSVRMLYIPDIGYKTVPASELPDGGMSVLEFKRMAQKKATELGIKP